MTDSFAQATLEALHIDLELALNTVADNLDLIEALTSSHKPAVLGFATVEGKQAADRLVRTERKARLENQQKGRPTGTGDVPAAGTIGALSLAAAFHTTIQHALRRCLRAITGGDPGEPLATPRQARPARPMYRVELQATIDRTRALGVLTEAQTRSLAHAQATADALDYYAVAVNLTPSTGELIEHLRTLGSLTRQPGVLREVAGDLGQLNIDAAAYLDGVDRTRLKAACPHCGHHTLVVYFDEGVVRCEKDPHTGRFDDCACPDPLCNCKTNPHHRHEWHRNLGTAPGGWWKLADRINSTNRSSDG